MLYTTSVRFLSFIFHGLATNTLLAMVGCSNFQLESTSSLLQMAKACAQKKDLFQAVRVHAVFMESGLHENCPYLGSSLVDMYVKCGDLKRSQEVLDDLPVRNVVAWNAIIIGYTQAGQGTKALNCLDQMCQEGLSPDSVTFSCVLKACGDTEALCKGKVIHNEVIKRGFLHKHDVVLGTALVDMYSKCGEMNKAKQVLHEMPIKNVVSWNVLLAGYAQQGQVLEAVSCLTQMQTEGLYPDDITYVCVLKACSRRGAVEEGQKIHKEIVCRGLLQGGPMLGNAVVDMYVKFGSLGKAQQVLELLPVQNVVTWSTLIAGYANQGDTEETLSCFQRMQSQGLSPNNVTFICMLKVCSCRMAIAEGKRIHNEVIKNCSSVRDVALGTALVDMYAKCGALEKARVVLEELPVRDIVAWNTLITGYAQHEQGEGVMDAFEDMQSEGFSPDSITYGCLLKACGNLGAVSRGREIHDEITVKDLLVKDIVLGNALVDMYAKCGVLERAKAVFDGLNARDMVTWNSLITGYSQQGQDDELLKCLIRMHSESIVPDSATFLCLLNVCSHSGLLDEGEKYFLDVGKGISVTRELDYYACIVDLFGRAGHFEGALRMFKTMPFLDYLPVWNALLSACRNQGNVALGRFAFEQAVQLDHNNLASYVLMINLYVAAGMHVEARKIENMRDNALML